jgi:CRISPR-associated endonuclease/helicase Cas3
MSFSDFFRNATKSTSELSGRSPYPYQIKYAENGEVPDLLNVPTGIGKTATAILGWLYRRRTRPDSTPRRLVYCLPMRTLVEQTEHEARRWLGNLSLDGEVGLHLLMGGAVRYLSNMRGG